MDHLKEMMTNWTRATWRTKVRSSGKHLLIEKSDTQDGFGYNIQVNENILNTSEEQGRFQTFPVVTPHAEQNRKQELSILISEDLSDSFPKPPVDVDQNLKPHLHDLNKALDEKHQRIRSSSCGDEVDRVIGKCLIEKCHHHMFDHVQNLLQNVNTFENCLLLINWVSQTYRSLCDPAKPLREEWEEDSNLKLMKCLEKDVPDSLDKILQTHSSQMCHNEETYVALYVDVIQCVDGKLQAVRNISTAPYEQVRKICFLKLLDFVKRYTEKQKELLGDEKQRWEKKKKNLETFVFLQTLKTCRELGNYVLPKSDDTQLSVQKEIVMFLEHLEMFSLDLLKEIVVDMAETGVKHYLKSGRLPDLQLEALKNLFPTRPYASEEQKIVMDEAYKIFAHTYLKDLLRVRQRRLRRWMQDVGRRVHTDAKCLHNTFSELAPGVQPWNFLLLKIQEVLDSEDIQGLKITIAMLKAHCEENSVCSEDLHLLPDLLVWKGLSRRKVNEVLEALPSSEESITVNFRTQTGCSSVFLSCCG